MNELLRVEQLLLLNGWSVSCRDNDYISYSKKNTITIDIGSGEVVFIDDIGDFLHLKICLYEVYGALVHLHILPAACEWPRLSILEVSDE